MSTTKPDPIVAPAPPDDVRLPTLQHGYRLGIPAGDMLEIFAPGGQLCLSIRLDPAGPLVELRAQSLRVAASGDVSVDCDTFNVHARRDISLVSAGDIAQDAGGDIVLRADGELATAAAGQQHHARLGSIDLRANDDVALDGERVLLNSPRAFAVPPVELESRQPALRRRDDDDPGPPPST